MSLNRWTGTGRLTRDPEMRTTQNGVAVTSFTLAVDRDRKNRDGERETDFIDIVAWRNTAEFVSKYFSKGKMATVDGRLQIRTYTDKDGNNRRAAEIVAETVYFGESKSAGDSNVTGQSGGYSGYQGYQKPAQNYGQNYQSRQQGGYRQSSYQDPAASSFSMLSDDSEGLPF